MKEIMGITDMLCKTFQHKSQDIVNAMDDVATTKKIDSGVKRPRLEQAY
jgi:hypothetical protein